MPIWEKKLNTALKHMYCFGIFRLKEVGSIRLYEVLFLMFYRQSGSLGLTDLQLFCLLGKQIALDVRKLGKVAVSVFGAG